MGKIADIKKEYIEDKAREQKEHLEKKTQLINAHKEYKTIARAKYLRSLDANKEPAAEKKAPKKAPETASEKVPEKAPGKISDAEKELANS